MENIIESIELTEDQIVNRVNWSIEKEREIVYGKHRKNRRFVHLNSFNTKFNIDDVHLFDNVTEVYGKETYLNVIGTYNTSSRVLEDGTIENGSFAEEVKCNVNKNLFDKTVPELETELTEQYNQSYEDLKSTEREHWVRIIREAQQMLELLK